LWTGLEPISVDCSVVRNALFVVILFSGCYNSHFAQTRPYRMQPRAPSSVLITWAPPPAQEFLEVGSIGTDGQGYREAVRHAVIDAARQGCDLLLIRDEGVRENPRPLILLLFDDLDRGSSLHVSASCFVRHPPPAPTPAGQRCRDHADCPPDTYCHPTTRTCAVR